MSRAPGPSMPEPDAADRSPIQNVFEPSFAEHPLRTLRIDDVIDLLHVSHWPQRVDEYRNAMRAGERFPPVAVVYFAGRPFLADGHKRFQAYRGLGATEIAVQVWPLRRWLADQSDQLRRSLRRWANAAGGLLDPARRPQSVDALSQIVDHWKRIWRSLATRREPAARRRNRIAGPSGPAAPSGLFVRLVRECLHDRGRLSLLALLLLGLAASQLALTWVAKLWAEGPLVSGDEAAMHRLLLAGAGLTVALTLGVFGSRYLLASVGQRLVQRLRDRVQQSLLGLSMEATRAMRAGDAISRIFSDAAMMAAFVEGVLRRLIGETILLAGAVSIMTYLNWRLAVATLIVVPLVGLLLHRLGAAIRELSARAQEGAGEMGAVLSEQLKGISTIKAFVASDFEEERFREYSARFRDQFVRSEGLKVLLVTLVWGATGISLLAVIWYGSRQVAGGQSTPGELLAFCLYAAQTIEPLRRLSDVQGLLQRSLAAAARVYEIIDSDGFERGGERSLPEIVTGELRFEDVSFSYRPGDPVLRHVNLSVTAGETIGIVAASGGGKSTLAALLVRFADPQAGRITLNGIDLRELRLADLRRAVCFVEQEPFVFSGSLIENVRYGRWDAPRRRVEAAIDMAGLRSFVRSLPGGADGRLVEGGRNLSGGQKQRIALARAIVRDPSVLVLDEATSAVDSDTERRIFAGLDRWLGQRTVVIMAHRLSTVSRCGRVVVLSEGRIAGDGSVTDLLRTCPEFSILFGEQLARSPLRREDASSVTNLGANLSRVEKVL